MTLAVSGAIGCGGTAEPAAAPGPSVAQSDDKAERDQRELEQRRLKLQRQVLAELSKLRESRQASTAGAEPASDDAAPASADFELLIFGGPSHEVFLGCLCDERRADSVFNMVGQHGSDVSPTSIRNKFEPYGSNHDETSACNAAATRPPIVVSLDGKSLGLLTMNPSLKKRISSPSVGDWLARMCGI
ncbi:MAG TPA: hypothetical protein VIW29_14380 [Polyangiaceae bacterium]